MRYLLTLLLLVGEAACSFFSCRNSQVDCQVNTANIQQDKRLQQQDRESWSGTEALPPGCGGSAHFLQKQSQLLVLGLKFDNMIWLCQQSNGTILMKINQLIYGWLPEDFSQA